MMIDRLTIEFFFILSFYIDIDYIEIDGLNESFRAASPLVVFYEFVLLILIGSALFTPRR